ncbi:MAG: sulfatase-like hydrolase/transferase [Kiritimatiellia bacterium]
MNPRPNILLIIPDQMRGDSLSCLGHPGVYTPNIDRLARDGVLFRRAYSTVASCIPARYALLTGLVPQTSGVVGFAAKPLSTPSLPGRLTDTGYATVLVGRDMHQPPESGTCGYQNTILGSTYIENDEYDRFLREEAPETGGIKKLIDDLGVTYNHWQAAPWPLADELHPTQWVVDQSLRVLERTNPDQPLFLTTSFYAPHPPLFPPKKFFDAAADRDLPDPAIGEWVKPQPQPPDCDPIANRVHLAGETLRAAQAGYYGAIDHIDACIGALIEAFSTYSEKADRPWVVVFISDHGEMLGDHDFFRKCEPYEGSANIPFIFTASADLAFASGSKNLRPVCLEDIMPTLLQLAGAPCPDIADGVDLSPTLQGKSQQVREWLHFEHAPCYSEEQGYHALTDGRYKYIWRTLNGTEQLFDLDKDPHEHYDLVRSAHQQVELKKWRQRLVERLTDRPEGFVREGNLVAGRDYPPLNTCKPRS